MSQDGVESPAGGRGDPDRGSRRAAESDARNRILNKSPSLYERSGPVSQLASLLLQADKVEITVGCALNPVSGDISFAQQGIMPSTTLC